MRFRAISPGDCMPLASFLEADGSVLKTQAFGGCYLVICFLGTDLTEGDQYAIDTLQHASVFDNPAHARLLMVRPGPPQPVMQTPRTVFDPDRRAAIAFGAAPRDIASQARSPTALALFDPMLRLIALHHLWSPARLAQMLALLERLPPPERSTGRALQAPVLYLPRVFARDLCARLIASYQAEPRALTGVMRHSGGQTIGRHDPAFKRRRDHLITDPGLKARIQSRICAAVLPELRKAFGFVATRMERYLVGCYSADEAGHFAPHRDNTTPATAHRRFAISINLNDDFEGGEVSFPEYSPAGFKAPAGTAVVFGCGLMHSVAPVTSGARYAFLPFVYDEAAARLRQDQPEPARQYKTAPEEGAVSIS